MKKGAELALNFMLRLVCSSRTDKVVTFEIPGILTALAGEFVTV